MMRIIFSVPLSRAFRLLLFGSGLIASSFFLLASEPSVTIYNQNFAVVRDTLALDLKAGANRVNYQDATVFLEPDSVTLRDPSGKIALRILEQSYRADPISMRALLTRYEGQTIAFLVRTADKTETVSGKIIRAGSAVQGQLPGQYRPYPPQPDQPIIEVDGKLRFDLPGIPLFPALSSGSILKPALDWTVHAAAPAKLRAELAYITAGMNWEAAYNIVETAAGPLEVTGWVSMENRTGKTFEKARVKLMAGDLNKIVRPDTFARPSAGLIGGVIGGMPGGIPPGVAEKAFDQYHLYTLPAPVTLHDQESKQVEFLRAANIKSEIIYVYDGLKLDPERMRMMPPDAMRMDPSFGAQSTNKVWVMREVENSKANELGMPLPKGRTRFYRRDSDAQMEFTGEDTIEHTPAGERVRVFTGAAFDLVGERRRTSHSTDHGRRTIDETFEIKVRNRRTEAAEVRVVEHLYRASTWEVTVSSTPFAKRDSDTVEFKVPLQPGAEATITYSVRYTW